jgi:hypothetical protein
LSFGFRVIVIVSAQAHLARVSLLSQPGTTARYPAGYPRHPAEGARTCHLGFPLPFGHRRSLLGSSQSRPGIWAFLTVGLPDTTRVPDPVGVTTFHTHELRPGWVPPRPRGRRCSPGRMPCPTGACRITAACPNTPLPHPIGGAPLYEASTEVHAIHPSGLPLAGNSRMEREPLGFPSGFAPRRYQRRTPRVGPGSEHAPGTTPPTSHRPPISESTRKV